ncbi:hypothetical protein BaRGS_00038974 [Batillaria attramentaria]|uniref:Uncharacterized protein n=1 Tax=Batillaria attramentaria TaxID=370345 RepID=A0ABD0J504_9CAEN
MMQDYSVFSELLVSVVCLSTGFCPLSICTHVRLGYFPSMAPQCSISGPCRLNCRLLFVGSSCRCASLPAMVCLPHPVRYSDVGGIDTTTTTCEQQPQQLEQQPQQLEQQPQQLEQQPQQLEQQPQQQLKLNRCRPST